MPPARYAGKPSQWRKFGNLKKVRAMKTYKRTDKEFKERVERLAAYSDQEYKAAEDEIKWMGLSLAEFGAGLAADYADYIKSMKRAYSRGDL